MDCGNGASCQKAWTLAAHSTARVRQTGESELSTTPGRELPRLIESAATASVASSQDPLGGARRLVDGARERLMLQLVRVSAFLSLACAPRCADLPIAWRSAVRLSQSLALVAEHSPQDLGRFRDSIEFTWIETALRATGTATLRRRRLPAPQVIWLVIGMALLRDRPIRDVVDKLDLALNPNDPLVAPSSISEARSRLGEQPLLWLFSRTAHAWGHASAERDRWRGLALFGVDGTTLLAPDTKQNVEYFGKSSGTRGQSGYPLLRLAALMALRSHMVVNAAFGPYGKAEQYYASELWSALPDDSLTVVDRGFWSAAILIPLARGGRNRHWLIRAKSTTTGRVVKKLGQGDALVELDVSSQARKQNPALPRTWLVRVIEYQRKGFRPQRLITSLLDSDRYPAKEIIDLYHERWELELAYDVIKTETQGGAVAPLRSKHPAGVSQEVWGLLIAYNLVRLEMERVADHAKVKPTRISFTMVLDMVCNEWLWLSGTGTPGAIPRHLQRLRADIGRCVLPERRARFYPRAVKITMSNYAKKRA
jgi:hypothetical protein